MSFGGKLASVSPSARTNTVLYAVGAVGSGRVGFNVNIRASNKNDYEVKIRIAIVDGLTASDLTEDDYIEYDTILRSNGVLENTGIKIKKNQSIVVYANTSNVNFAMWA